MSKNGRKLKCPLGELCYRKKKEHFRTLKHHQLEKLLKEYGHLNFPSTYVAKISLQTVKEQLKLLQEIDTKSNSDNSDNDAEIIEAPNINQSTSSNKSFNGEMSNRCDSMSSDKICSYGEKCYRKNPAHFETLDHPHLDKLLKIIGDKEIHIPNGYHAQISHETLKQQLSCIKDKYRGKKDDLEHNQSSPSSSGSVSGSKRSRTSLKTIDQPEMLTGKKNESECRKSEENRASSNKTQEQAYRIVILDRTKNSILDKLMVAAPYNFFLTTVSNSPETHNEMLSVTFAELVDPNLGDLECSLQINFMVEVGWLLAQYQIMGHRHKPLTLLYGEVDMELERFNHFLTSVKVKTPSSFGSHHTKMMIFSYTDKSIRVVVSTANLVESDWDNRTQGLWISPRCRILEEGSDTMAGDSPTNFKRDLIKYLSAYQFPELVQWIKKIQNVNMSAINVFFIASIPGTHYSSGGNLKHNWGHPSLAKVLNEHTTIPDNNSYKVIAQCSSIGSLGPKPDSWLLGEMLTTFTSGKRNGLYSKPNFKFIYPSFENVASSYDGLLGGGCLPYSRTTHQRQEWLTSFTCQWISEERHRTRAPPHIKTYCRVSPDMTKLSYFLLTSANLSKAAWGILSKSGSINILSYEAGVLFLPQFIIGKDFLPLTTDVAESCPLFPMPYDLPTTPYAFTDSPWFIENLML